MKTAFSTLVLVLRILVAGVFIFSAILKLTDQAGFLDDVQGFGVLPYDQAYLVALVLPWLELLCGLAVLTWRYSAAASLLMIGMNGGFIYFIRHALQQGREIDCGCFGTWVVFQNHDHHLIFLWVLMVALAMVFVRTFMMAQYDD